MFPVLDVLHPLHFCVAERMKAAGKDKEEETAEDEVVQWHFQCFRQQHFRRHPALSAGSAGIVVDTPQVFAHPEVGQLDDVLDPLGAGADLSYQKVAGLQIPVNEAQSV